MRQDQSLESIRTASAGVTCGLGVRVDFVDTTDHEAVTDALAAAWSRVLSIAARPRHEEAEVPPERYSVEQRTAEIEEVVRREGRVAFGTLLGEAPTLSFAVVTFIALLDLYRRLVIDLEQDELFGDIRITRKEPAANA